MLTTIVYNIAIYVRLSYAASAGAVNTLPVKTIVLVSNLNHRVCIFVYTCLDQFHKGTISDITMYSDFWHYLILGVHVKIDIA